MIIEIKEAEKALEKIKIYNKLKRFAEENNKHEIDWKNIDQIKYVIVYSFASKYLTIQKTFEDKDIGQIYFTSGELAEQAIKEIGEENIKKLFD